MMDLPLTTLSSQLMEGVPYSSNLSFYTGYVYGGPSIGTSDNFKVLYKWEYEYHRPTGTLKVWREDKPDEKIVVFDDKPDLYEISFCFNKTMDFIVSYVRVDGSYLRTYDPIQSRYYELYLEKAITPRVALSSVHSTHAPYSEGVVGYIRSDTHELCIRLERDRYLKERVVKKFERRAKLVNISYSDNNRFQYELLEAL